MALTEEQIEEYKQIDARILLYIAQVHKLTTAYFIGFVAFCAWIAKGANQANVIPFALLLAFGLLLGLVLLVIDGRAIDRLRAYKIVFCERESDCLKYESARIWRNGRSTGRTWYYGFLGLIIHVIAACFVLLDPLDTFARYDMRTMVFVVAMFTPGLIYSAVMAFGKGKKDFQKYLQWYERIKKEMSDQNSKPDM